MHVFLNNRLIPAAEAKVSVFDRGFAYGDALFETLKVLKGRPVFLREHCERLRNGLEAAGFHQPPDCQELLRQALALAAKNEVELGRLRILVTRGDPQAPSGPDPVEGLTPTLLLTVEPFSGFPGEAYSAGVAVRTVGSNRGPYASLKSSGLLGAILARQEAFAAGAQEAILTSGQGRILEGSYSNIFFLAGRLLVTAAVTDPILAGVTRQKIIELAPEAGLSVEQHAPRLDELGFGETAAFLTSSLLGICPVREIDGVELKMAPDVFQLLDAGLRRLELQDVEAISVF